MFKSNEKMFHYVELIRTILTFQYVTQAIFSYLPTINVIFLMFSLVPSLFVPLLCKACPELWPCGLDCLIVQGILVVEFGSPWFW